MTERQALYDGVAIGTSVLCLFHCLVLPALMILLPTLAAFFVIPKAFHVWAIAFVVPSSALALMAGHRRHRSPLPTLIVIPGLALLAIGAFVAPTEALETGSTVTGAIILAIGHTLNLRAPRCPNPTGAARARI